MKTSLLRNAGMIAALLVCVSVGSGQSGKDARKSSDILKTAFTDIVAAAADSTVQVRYNSLTVALGTVIDSRGYIVTKASEITEDKITNKPSEKLTVKLRDDREFHATLVDI